VGKILYLLFGMTGAFLSITGFLLWWRKLRNKKVSSRRFTRTPESARQPATSRSV
jgi:uncharacterized iron-regulated membrane protein